MIDLKIDFHFAEKPLNWILIKLTIEGLNEEKKSGMWFSVTILLPKIGTK